MIEFELANTSTGLLVSINLTLPPTRSISRLWHDLVEHSYDALANGWEDELIAIGRQLIMSYVPRQVNTIYFFDIVPRIVGTNIRK